MSSVRHNLIHDCVEDNELTKIKEIDTQSQQRRVTDMQCECGRNLRIVYVYVDDSESRLKIDDYKELSRQDKPPHPAP